MFLAVSLEGELIVKGEAHQPLYVDPFPLQENKATAAIISAKEGGVCGGRAEDLHEPVPHVGPLVRGGPVSHTGCLPTSAPGSPSPPTTCQL